jgi:alpha-ribazole phosphatase
MLRLPPQGEATRLLLVRHVETDSALRGHCYGRLDVPLSAEGRRQAGALAAALADVPLTAVYSSPLARARDTAAPIAAGRGLEPAVDEALAEMDFGELEGLSYDEIRAARPDVFRAWMETPTSVRFPRGESFADLRERVLAAVGGLRERHHGEAVAVVAHGGVVRVVLADALGLADGAVFRLDQAYGGVSVVDWLPGAPVVRVVNALFRTPLGTKP